VQGPARRRSWRESDEESRLAARQPILDSIRHSMSPARAAVEAAAGGIARAWPPAARQGRPAPCGDAGGTAVECRQRAYHAAPRDRGCGPRL